MTDNNSSDSVYKVILLGDSTVGKKYFLMRCTDNTFHINHIPTIGIDYRLKKMTLNSGKQVKVKYGIQQVKIISKH